MQGNDSHGNSRMGNIRASPRMRSSLCATIDPSAARACAAAGTGSVPPLFAKGRHRHGIDSLHQQAILAALQSGFADQARYQEILRGAARRRGARQAHDPRSALPHRRSQGDHARLRAALRVFTPLDIDFSLASGLKVTEDSRGTILFFHGADGSTAAWTSIPMPAPRWRSSSNGAWYRSTIGARPSTASPRRLKTATKPRASCMRARCYPMLTRETSCCSAIARAATSLPWCRSWPHDRGEFLPRADAFVSRNVQRPQPDDLAVRFGARERGGLPAHRSRYHGLHGVVRLLVGRPPQAVLRSANRTKPCRAASNSS